MVNAPHIPVMLPEVLEALVPKDGETYVDGTLGAGGYTRGILSALDCRVIGVDRDLTAHNMATQWGKEFSSRLTLVKNSFGNLETALDALGVDKVDGIVLDLGVSSMQFDEAQRGFSFRFDAPLDMRMDREDGAQTAADIVNSYPEEELANLIYLYGEERKSRSIAAAIVRQRALQPIQTTKQLADIVRSVLRVSPWDKIDPSTRTFQALRIAVNDELGELERVLSAAEKRLKSGGRLVVVTFHSLEDRIVKNFLQERSRPAPSPSRHVPVALDAPQSRLSFSLVTKKPVLPTEQEMHFNPRSRSAKLRAAIRTEVA